MRGERREGISRRWGTVGGEVVRDVEREERKGVNGFGEVGDIGW